MKRLKSGISGLGVMFFLVLRIGVSPAEARLSPAGNATFGTPTALNTNVVIDSTGTWYLQLTVTDNAKTSTVVTTVTVTSLNVSPKLIVGNAAGIGGNAVDIIVSLSTGTTGVAGLQFDLDSPMALTMNTVTAGAASTAAGKSVQGNVAGNDIRVIVFGLNQSVIGPGALAVINVQVPAGQVTGAQALTLLNATATDAAGATVTLAASGAGLITVTANKAPVVTVGAAQAISTLTLPITANLAATATDDGAPNPPSLMTYSWTVL